MDDNNSHKLCFSEFNKAIKDYRVGVDEATVRLLFDACDRDKSGEVDYDEFIRMIRGEMNESRKRLAELAFNKLDKDGSGILEVSDVKGTYNAKNHPDVKAGRKTEDDVLGDFLETFEMHLNLGGGSRDRKITKEEFMEYYNNVSASIDDDRYFEVMMTNAWKLQGEDLKKPAWRTDYGGAAAGLRSSPGSKAGVAPYGVSAAPVEYRSAAKAQQDTVVLEESKAVRPPTHGTPGEKPAESPATGEVRALVNAFRQCLATRGARGIFGMQRVFKVLFLNDSRISRRLSMMIEVASFRCLSSRRSLRITG